MRLAYLKEYDVDVSDNGDIFNARTGFKYKHCKDKLGYLRAFVTVSKGKRAGLSVHRAVALAFLENPENKPDVNHKDGSKANNHVSNLEWVTRKENIDHAYRTGLMDNKIAKTRKTARHTLVNELIQKGYKREFLALAFGVSETVITNITKHQKHF